MYDFGTTHRDHTLFGCTSIIINTDKPYILHNLDYSFENIIKGLTAKVHYYRGDRNDIIATTMGIVG